jgi:GTP-binding protein YchF
MLRAGIVGLPNVGKSTLFNAITKSAALAANYPFATIDPNVGVVTLKDKRLEVLSTMYKSGRIVPTTVEFIDIAGLVKGASKGEGLGNQFLSHIRDVDTICQVVRLFKDDNIIHVEGSVDPLRDIDIIQLELNISDYDTVMKRIPKIEKKAKAAGNPEEKEEFEILSKVKQSLEDNIPIRLMDLTTEERTVIRSYNFLSAKAMIYIVNVSESEIRTVETNPIYLRLVEKGRNENADVVYISAQIESELAQLDDDDKALFMEELGLHEAGLDQLIRTTYHRLGLQTYFTAGPMEAKAWTFRKGMTAPQCAGIIHSDFERGFIRAETVAYDDLIKYGSYMSAKEAGRVRQEGKDYLVKDGDVMLFKFNV